MRLKTTHTEQVWTSPDGVKTIWEVTLKGEDGKEYHLKTYSPKIAEMGFAGEVESYVSPRGDRFARQVAQKAGGGRDDYAIRAQWAIGQAIALASVTMDKKTITMPVIEKYAKELFSTVGRVKGEPFNPAVLAQAENYIQASLA
jgi:hypothetical protein